MLDLFSELIAIAERLDDSGVRYALVGGLAYSVWVEARATEDIDLLIDGDAWPSVADHLAGLGYQRIAAEMDFAGMRIRRLTKIEPDDVLTLDLLLADGRFAAALDSAVQVDHGGGTLRVARPEAIIELKKLRLSARDELDIAGLERLIDEQK